MKLVENENNLNLLIDNIDLEIMTSEIKNKISDFTVILNRIKEFEKIMQEYFENQRFYYTNTIFSHPFAIMKRIIEKALMKKKLNTH